MPLPKNINAYNDIRRVLETVVQRGGIGRYRTESISAATRWRLRAYMYRRLLQVEAKAAGEGIPGYNPTTPYDSMVLRLDGYDVIIQMDGQAIPGELVDETGKTMELLDLEPTEIDKDDPLLLEALKLSESSRDK